MTIYKINVQNYMRHNDKYYEEKINQGRGIAMLEEIDITIGVVRVDLLRNFNLKMK